MSSYSIPKRAGIGLRPTHYREVIETLPNVSWWEVHSENFFAKNSFSTFILNKVKEHYPISLHGVGLSIGSVKKPNHKHLKLLQEAIERFEPALVSEHLSWSEAGGVFSNDLLPLPYTQESLRVTINNINYIQDYLKRQILLENPSSYLAYKSSAMTEVEFLVEVAKRSGCGILLDINNIYVSACNNNFDPYSYLQAIPVDMVGEIHLAGYTKEKVGSEMILIDSHDHLITEPVWGLYESAIQIFGAVPTLIEWDTDLPSLEVLRGEADKADTIIAQLSQSELGVLCG